MGQRVKPYNWRDQKRKRILHRRVQRGHPLSKARILTNTSPIVKEINRFKAKLLLDPREKEKYRQGFKGPKFISGLYEFLESGSRVLEIQLDKHWFDNWVKVNPWITAELPAAAPKTKTASLSVSTAGSQYSDNAVESFSRNKALQKKRNALENIRKLLRGDFDLPFPERIPPLSLMIHDQEEEGLTNHHKL